MADVKIPPVDISFVLPKSSDPSVQNVTAWKPRGRKLKYKRPSPGVTTICKDCGLESPPHAAFHVHVKQHEKPFACNLCGTSFGRKPYLDVHLRTHTGERPYECQMCHKRFTQKSSLNTHTRVHTGERPYSCDVCHKTFALKSYVAAHRWSHVTKEEMICGVCATAFTSKSVLMAHLRSHHSSSQPQHCNICGRRFLRSGYLARHHAQAHAILEVTPSIQVGNENIRINTNDDYDSHLGLNDEYDATTDDDEQPC